MAIAVLLFTHQLQPWHVYIATVVSSAFSTVQRPAYAAAVPAFIPAQQLGRTSGLRRVASALAEFAPPLVAGYLVFSVGLGRVILIDVVTFLVALGTLLAVRFPSESRPELDRQQSVWHVAQGARAGWRYIFARPSLRSLLVLSSITWFLGVPAEMLLTPYVLATHSAAVLGWVGAAISAGLLAGGLVMTAWGGPKRRIVGILGFECLVGVCLVVIGVRLPPALILLAMFVQFAALALSDGCGDALWQTKVAPAFLGRVFAIRDVAALCMVPLGTLLLAPLAEFVLGPALTPGGVLASNIGHVIGVGPGRGIGLIFMMAGVFNILAVLVAWTRPQVRRIDLDIPDVET